MNTVSQAQRQVVQGIIDRKALDWSKLSWRDQQKIERARFLLRAGYIASARWLIESLGAPE